MATQSLELSASLFAAHPLKIAETIQDCLKIGIRHLHLDIMDMHYVPNLALSFDTVQCIAETFPTCTLDIHLMVQNPITAITKLPQKSIRHLYFHPHAEHAVNQKIIQHIHEIDALAGCTLNPNESWEVIAPLLDKVHCGLIMGVIPGFSGQKFQDKALQNLKKIHTYPDIHWAVDGGVNSQTLPMIQEFPVDHCVLGSALVQGNIQKNYHSLQESIKNALV